MQRVLTVSVVAVVLVVIGIAYLYFNGRSAMACSDVSPRPTIVAFGDSLVEGYGAPKGSDFVSVLSHEVGLPITNLGVSGDTTADGLARARKLTVFPDIAIILLGGNDALRKTPKTETRANLAAIIELFKAKGTEQIILVGVLGGFPNDPYASMFKELSQEYELEYVPNILSGLIGNRELMSDQVHPNAAGYARIAKRLVPTVNAMCHR